MQVINEMGAVPLKMWVGERREIRGGELCVEPDIEETALQQLRNIARLPFIAGNGLAAMPDVHAGHGATVGSVIATKGAVIPAAVGVDIGCGMNAVRTDITADMLDTATLDKLFGLIDKAVPTGRGQHKDVHGAFSLGRTGHTVLAKHFETDYMRAATKAGMQLGTLGGGNHFIEICLDESNAVWIMLHSGSRGIGNMIGSHFIDLAKREMENYFIKLADDDLAYLSEVSPHFKDYCEAVAWAQDYAMENRRQMMRSVHSVLSAYFRREVKFTTEAVNCHHNYIDRENHFGQNLWVTRKGAIRAREGDMGIIPGSMGAKSFIVRGKGNRDSYCSCSHGAGRVMGRKEAARRYTAEDVAAQTVGVVCRKDVGVVDEIPSAYKDIDVVMANQTDLVEIVHTLKQVLCVKGA